MSGNHRTPILLCSLHHISGERHKKQRKCGNFGENFAWNLHFLVKLWISHNGDYWHWSVVCVLCSTMPLLGSTRPVIVQMVVKNTPYWLLSTMNIYIHTSPNSRVICHDIQCHDVMTSYIMLSYIWCYMCWRHLSYHMSWSYDKTSWLMQDTWCVMHDARCMMLFLTYSMSGQTLLLTASNWTENRWDYH